MEPLSLSLLVGLLFSEGGDWKTGNGKDPFGFGFQFQVVARLHVISCSVSSHMLPLLRSTHVSRINNISPSPLFYHFFYVMISRSSRRRSIGPIKLPKID